MSDRRAGGTLLLAVGGNALLRAGEEADARHQRLRAEETARAILPVALAHERVLVVHGNGPQVGHEMLRGEVASGAVEPLPLDVLVADCQGAMGYVFQQALGNALRSRGISREVVTIVTQVVVDERDPAFADPRKPIGRHGSAEEARRWRSLGYTVREEPARGFRRVVPSPRPVAIVEAETIAGLVATGSVVVAAGGGGVPVALRDGALVGVPAVVDKDAAAELLALRLRPDLLVVLTDVDEIHAAHGTPAERALRDTTVAELERLEAAGEFPPGSMGPKVRCVTTAVAATGCRALVTSPERLADAMAGRAGTWVAG